MSTPTTPVRPAPVEPVPGERFQRVAALPVEGDAGRLLLLLAAFADSSPAYRPSTRELARHLGLDRPRDADPLVRELEAAGLVRVWWSPRGSRERNRYKLRLGS